MSETKGLTNDLLKEKMTDAMVIRGYASLDLNDYKQAGVYLLNGKILQNAPFSGLFYGILRVTNAYSSTTDQGYLLQELIPSNGQTIAKRTFWFQSWNDWNV